MDPPPEVTWRVLEFICTTFYDATNIANNKNPTVGVLIHIK